MGVYMCVYIYIYIYTYISDSNETDFCGFETSETFFMFVSKQMKPDNVGFETN